MSPEITEHSFETAIECGQLQHGPTMSPIGRFAVRLTRGPAGGGS